MSICNEPNVPQHRNA